ncbi:ABC transporter permease [Clostridium estertheticum]|uniref:ABC transporter permease n=1 Tax=Clostridium estertheticum TaxID=238834 RepID=UPI001C7D9220|nr:ABC transporter permease [Clostridium estertheticum]MBX4270431.1 ABC transporter permease [Clostridium estertheticum]WLC81320.1 ABC transporter permease [Clostridium estertheticum]
MLKIFKNEIIKMVSSKKFYLLCAILIFSIILMGTVKNPRINANNFMLATLDGMVMKPIVPIFMVLVIVEVLTDDYSLGTMKFSLMTTIKKSDFIIGKLLFIALYALIFMAISFIFSYIVGTTIFGLGGKEETIKNLVYNIKCYGVLILPLLSFCAMMSLIALLINNSGAMIGLGIGIIVILSTLISVQENVIYFMPGGGMYAASYINKSGPHSIFLFAIVAVIYIIVFSFISSLVINKKDIVQ